MRAITFSVNNTDAVHVYSDPQRIWLQLRRDVPTQQDIGKPSFKAALSLTPAQAIAIAGELLTAATRYQTTLPAPPAQSNDVAQPINHGKPWTPIEDKRLCEGFEAQTPIPELAKRHQRGVGGIESRLAKLGKLSPEQRTFFKADSK